MTCVNCGAPLRLDRTQMFAECGYCRSRAPLPEGAEGVVVVGETPHRCPVCEDTRLHDGRIEARPVHYCHGCRGILVPMGGFLPLIEHLRTLRDRAAEHVAPRGTHDADRAIPCPLCSTTMLNYVYGGGGNVSLDSCRTCEVIWLDHQELRRIVLAPDPRPPYGASPADQADILEA